MRQNRIEGSPTPLFDAWADQSGRNERLASTRDPKNVSVLEPDSVNEARQVWNDLEPDIRKVARALQDTGPDQPLISHGLVGGFHFSLKHKVTAANYRAFTTTQGSTRVGY